ncbi:CoA ester lyase [Vineibacter terrae]|uniref:CoA ester lyase n=1 Tax=Vineibacter terrae TaxID=2586908 RepID=A0A5C8PQY3_9HYPH|nr:CoA ester lyase [Vineibacter terrae]TXL77606.1 CoA ester lyase [Vineibacter terrae]
MVQRLRRSKLFVPGNRPDLMRKAAAGPADSLSFDLEDAVPQDGKSGAREITAAFLAAGASGCGKQIVVRVNALDTGLMIADILAVASAPLHAINVPKCESPRDLHVADAVLAHVEAGRGLPRGSIGLMATIETPAGLRNAHAIAGACPRVDAIQLGLGDLKAVTGMRPQTHRLGAVRTLVILAAAEAGIAAFDSAFVNVVDAAAFETDATEARDLGFAGKSCIHPSQVEPCNRIFAPADSDIEEARALLRTYDDAAQRGIGAVLFRGRLVDAVHAAEARKFLGQLS